jgi:hypothetical protein
VCEQGVEKIKLLLNFTDDILTFEKITDYEQLDNHKVDNDNPLLIYSRVIENDYQMD